MIQKELLDFLYLGTAQGKVPEAPQIEPNEYFQSWFLRIAFLRVACVELRTSKRHGEVSEWLKELAWKACIRQRIEGSNPSLTAKQKSLGSAGVFFVWLGGVWMRTRLQPDFLWVNIFLMSLGLSTWP